VTEQYERSYPHAKTLNMLPSYLAFRRASAAGAYDALLIDSNGNITEGTRTNSFVVKGKTLVSPPEAKILLGVMRKVVLKVAGGNGFKVEERDISLDSLGAYDGAFLTSTSSKVMPISSIDDHSLGDVPEPLKELMRLTEEFLSNCGGNLE
jgi:branched-subunit amino acid aminotransferase/4-amino-4-deoxychorismate lyase